MTRAQLYSFDCGTRFEHFFDSTYIESISNCFFKANKPIKSTSNPILPSGINTDTWDKDKLYECTLLVGTRLHKWYVGWPDGSPNTYLMCYTYSDDDGATWTKPNLGYITYNGNTNNNLILGEKYTTPSVIYDESQSSDKRYLLMFEHITSTRSVDTVIYKAANPEGPYTLINTVVVSTGGSLEPKSFEKRADGKYYIYFTEFVTIGVNGYRNTYLYISDSTDPAGTWTNYGRILGVTSVNRQNYNLRAKLIDGVYYGFNSRYNDTLGQMFGDLYYSYDGITFRPFGVNSIPLGESGEWDDEMVITPDKIVENGNEWQLWYTGSPENHSYSIPRDSRIGLATIGKKRLSNIYGNGYFITTSFTPTDKLYLNFEKIGGNIQVEVLLAADNSVVSGYSKDDMDDLNDNSFSEEVTWGSNSLPTGTSIKLKFYLS